MEDTREKKAEVRKEMTGTIEGLDAKKQADKSKKIENRLFSFANFMEATIVLLFVGRHINLSYKNIVEKCLAANKIVVLPSFDAATAEIIPLKVDNFDRDLVEGSFGFLEPDPARCKRVPIDRIDIALIPGLAFDEKGGRVGSGNGFYDRLIPLLPVTTRKVALAYEEQILQQVPMESHDKFVDIIITEKRIVYKI